MEPPLEPADTVFNMILAKSEGTDPEIFDLVESGLYQAAGTKIYAMASILNVPMEYVSILLLYKSFF